MSNFILHGIVAFSVWRVWKLRWKWAEPNTGTSHLFQHLCLTDPRCLEQIHGVADFQNRKASKFDSGVGNEIQWPSCHRVGTPAGNVTNFFKWLMKTRCHFRNSTTKNLPAHISAEVHHLLADTGAKGRWYIWQVPGSLGQRWSWRILDGYVSQSKSLIFRPNHRALQHFHTFMALRFLVITAKHCAIPLQQGSTLKRKPRSSNQLMCPLLIPNGHQPGVTLHMPWYQQFVVLGRPRCSAATGVEMKIRTDFGSIYCWIWFQRPVYYFRKVKLPGCFI